MSVGTPRMLISFEDYLIADVIECRVHLGCTKEVSSFEFLLQNWDKKYSPGGSIPLAVGMEGYIKIGRSASPPQIISGRIEKLSYIGKPPENYLRVSGRCLGERLFRRVYSGLFRNVKGEDVVKYLLDYYVGLSHTRDSTELVEDTSTTYTKLFYENTPCYDIIRYIADSADYNGVIGYDFRVAPDGKFEFFRKNSKTSPVSLSEVIEEYEFRRDISRIRNKVRVYGKNTRVLSGGLEDIDGWTEDTLGWSSDGQVSKISYQKVVGNYAIQAFNYGDDWAPTVYLYRSFDPISCKFSYDMKKLKLYLLWGATRGASEAPQLEIYLFSGSTGANGFRQVWDLGSRLPIKQNTWSLLEIPVGPDYESSDITKGWLNMYGDWETIQRIQLTLYYSSVGTGHEEIRMVIDGLHFAEGRFNAVAEDANSQNTYGLRELTETDDELTSNDECLLRAKALLDYYKNPTEHLTVRSTILDYGNTPILPGDTVHVTLPNENIDSDYRVESVEYYVDASTKTLEVTLELGKETPLLADYIYALRSKLDQVSRVK